MNWFVMKIRPSWKSVSETMALAMPMPWPRKMPTKDVSSLADARFDWTQMKMHILERRDAVLAHAIISIVKEKAHRRVLRCLACTPA